MAKHLKEIEFTYGGHELALEIDTEDPENYVIESVTVLNARVEYNLDLFVENLDIDDWQRIKELVDRVRR